MVILISPAKTFSKVKPSISLPHLTTPTFAKESQSIAKEAQKLSPIEMKQVFNISEKMTQKIREQWSNFENAEVMPAAIAYNGMVFKHLDAAHFTQAQWLVAKEHLLIASFLYGLLRPTDGIKPYRMEGGVRFTKTAPEGLFAFWKDKLTPYLINYVKKRGGELHFLASEEMKRLFYWEEVKTALKIIEYDFSPIGEDGKVRKQIIVYTKMQRGDTSREIITSQAKKQA